ncbi:MAG: peptide chain release factor N(5)-glutamine methyltransferase [Clostridia bacterium]|nr:peptide chain release factor N(5)-glutamine methyltransferase [Clostridia bacterium]
MVIKDLLLEGIRILEKNLNINTQLETRLILSKLMEVDKSYLYAYEDKSVNDSIVKEFIELVKKRSQGYPLQYIIGTQEFMGLDFNVRKGVLIPRGDTEILVQYLIHYIKKKFQEREFSLLDIGIGSGAISLAIAHYCPNGNIFGVDIKEDALEIALENMKKMNLNNVKYTLGDIFSPFDKNIHKFDIIVSNPPYIPDEEEHHLQIEVAKHEPRSALFGGFDGLDFYKRITKEAKDYLKKGSILAYEVGHNQGEDVKSILEEYNYVDVTIIKDLEERDRVVIGAFVGSD